MPKSQSSKIRALNDHLRQTFQGGKVMTTQGIQSLGEAAVAMILQRVSQFNTFTKDNDPYGEHDFGSFTINGQKVLWKIDYYDKAMEFGSPDPTDPNQTTRVLTIMLASEY